MALRGSRAEPWQGPGQSPAKKARANARSVVAFAQQAAEVTETQRTHPGNARQSRSRAQETTGGKKAQVSSSRSRREQAPYLFMPCRREQAPHLFMPMPKGACSSLAHALPKGACSSLAHAHAEGGHAPHLLMPMPDATIFPIFPSCLAEKEWCAFCSPMRLDCRDGSASVPRGWVRWAAVTVFAGGRGTTLRAFLCFDTGLCPEPHRALPWTREGPLALSKPGSRWS